MAIAFLIIGLVAGAAAGYYYATFMEQPSDAMVMDDGTQTQDQTQNQTQDQIDQTQADTNASSTDVNAGAEASTSGALDDVQTNPFQ